MRVCRDHVPRDVGDASPMHVHIHGVDDTSMVQSHAERQRRLDTIHTSSTPCTWTRHGGVSDAKPMTGDVGAVSDGCHNRLRVSAGWGRIHVSIQEAACVRVMHCFPRGSSCVPYTYALVKSIKIPVRRDLSSLNQLVALPLGLRLVFLVLRMLSILNCEVPSAW